MSRDQYEVRVRGRLTTGLTAEFESQSLAVGVEPVQTVIRGPLLDQAALYGLLRRIESMGLELVDVRRIALATESPAEELAD